MNIRKPLAAFAAAFLIAATAMAQSADEIVKKHMEAVGGKAWEKVTSLRQTGKMTVQGMPIDLVLTQVEGKGMRQDISVMGTKNYIIITPTAGWQFFPVQGQTEPVDLGADAVAAGATMMSVQEEFFKQKKAGAKFESAGKETIDGKEYLKITITGKDGEVSTAYLDPTTYYTYRIVAKAKDEDGAEKDMVTSYSDYKTLPEGITVPMTMSSDAFGGNITMATVEVNAVKDESIFSKDSK